MSECLDISVAEDEKGGVTARVSGEIDLANVDQFRHALDTGGAPGGGLTVDLSGVTYLDSAGVAVLFDRAAQGPLEVLCRTGSIVAAVLEITHLGDVAVLRED